MFHLITVLILALSHPLFAAELPHEVEKHLASVASKFQDDFNAAKDENEKQSALASLLFVIDGSVENFDKSGYGHAVRIEVSNRLGTLLDNAYKQVFPSTVSPDSHATSQFFAGNVRVLRTDLKRYGETQKLLLQNPSLTVERRRLRCATRLGLFALTGGALTGLGHMSYGEYERIAWGRPTNVTDQERLTFEAMRNSLRTLENPSSSPQLKQVAANHIFELQKSWSSGNLLGGFWWGNRFENRLREVIKRHPGELITVQLIETMNLAYRYDYELAKSILNDPMQPAKVRVYAAAFYSNRFLDKSRPEDKEKTREMVNSLLNAYEDTQGNDRETFFNALSIAGKSKLDPASEEFQRIDALIEKIIKSENIAEIEKAYPLINGLSNLKRASKAARDIIDNEAKIDLGDRLAEGGPRIWGSDLFPVGDEKIDPKDPRIVLLTKYLLFDDEYVRSGARHIVTRYQNIGSYVIYLLQQGLRRADYMEEYERAAAEILNTTSIEFEGDNLQTLKELIKRYSKSK